MLRPSSALISVSLLLVAVLTSPAHLYAVIGGGPYISSLTPASGAVETQVTIVGSNFGSSPGTVTFNGTSAAPISWDTGSITVQVPSGATTGDVVVTANAWASNGVAFTVIGPPFTSTGSLATPRMFHTATLLHSGSVLVAGGVDGFAYHALPSAEVYNPASGTFSSTGNLNSARIFNTATLLNNGEVLIVGGADSNWNNIAAAEVYNPVSGTFTLTGALNDARSVREYGRCPTTLHNL